MPRATMLFPSVLFSTFLLVCPVALASVMVDLKVLTRQGYVMGLEQDIRISDYQMKIIYKFLGVPYAEKPIGDLRFKPPQPLNDQRQGVYQATSHPPICYQNQLYYFQSIKEAWPEFDPKRDMSEDCLYLNIYTPSLTCGEKYPVIVHIHGGSYFAGTPTRDISPGEYLPTRDIVLVTIQYRLGPFGFFSTGDSEAPGNSGLLDQVEALKWIQQNIDGFCGDKNSVTLLGESAGGSSVSLHYLSPLSRGLFHRGIAVSGVEFSPFALKPKCTVLEASRMLAKSLNCMRESSIEIVTCLRSLDGSIVFDHSLYHLTQPFVDQHFLPDEPKKLREQGKFQKLPLMSGFVSQEGSFMYKQYQIDVCNFLDYINFLETFFKNEFGLTKYDAPDAFNALRSQYTPNDVNNPDEVRRNLINMFSDYFMIAPTLGLLPIHSDHGVPTYMFEFAHRSQYHPKPPWMGVVHEDTTAYKFGLPFLDSTNTQLRFDDDDKKVSDIVVTTFTNFAKFGNPTPSPVHGVSWPEFESSTKAYLEIKKNPAIKREYHPRRMAFWNSLFPMLLLSNTGEKKSSLCNKVEIVGKPKLDIIW